MTRLEAIVASADLTIDRGRKRTVMTDREIHQRARQVAETLGVPLATVTVTLIQEWLRQGADVSILVGQMGNNSSDQVGINATLPQKTNDRLIAIRDTTPGFTMQGLANVLLSAWADAHGEATEGQTVEPRIAAHKPVSSNAKVQMACRISKDVLARAQALAKKQGVSMSQLSFKLLSDWVANGEDGDIVRKRPVADKRQSKPLSMCVTADIAQKARKIAASGRDFTLGDLMTSLLENWCSSAE